MASDLALAGKPEKAMPSLEQQTQSLVDILYDGAQRLAAAGDIEGACIIAGRACATLRHDDPKGWKRFNVLLHRLCPKLP